VTVTSPAWCFPSLDLAGRSDPVLWPHWSVTSDWFTEPQGKASARLLGCHKTAVSTVHRLRTVFTEDRVTRYGVTEKPRQAGTLLDIVTTSLDTDCLQ
jgi:hypothetical protein